MKLEDVLQEDIKELIEDAYEDLRGFIKLSYDNDKIIKKLRKMNYTDEIIEKARMLYNQRHASQFSSSILQGTKYKDRMNWYEPVENPDPSSRWGKLVQVLESKGWPKDNIKSLDNQSNDVVASLTSPKATQPDLVKGMVIGYVQSGKTANFSATIAKATDEGYKLIIVLSGMHNGLRYQTEKRLRSELVDPHGGRNSFNLTEVDKNGDFKSTSVHPNSVLNSKDKFTLVVLKKNTSPLKKFFKWVQEADDEVVKDCPVLIIDDEADQASVNNARGDKITAINRLIRDIVNYFGERTSCSYVGYTATPFANILIDAQESGDLFPRDFIIALKAPDTYIGAERLFGRASVDMDGGETGLNLIRHINVEDTISKDEDKVNDTLSESLRKAILSFFLASGERVRRRHLQKHITMLVHTSHLKEQHSTMYSNISTFVNECKIFLENDEDVLKSELQEIWNSDFVKTNNNDFPGVKLGSFEEVYEGLKHFVESMKPVIKENSESEYRLDFDEGPVWGIIVGGNTLSRGLTVEGLTTTYFHRTSTGYDTLLQMGRWFGYRPDYLDLTRTYVTADMESNFYHIATAEEELRDQIKRMQANNERPIDIALVIRDHDRLNITNKIVLKKNGTLASNSYSGTKLQASHVFLEDKDIAQNNFDAVKCLISNAENSKLRAEIKSPVFSRCILYKNVGVGDIQEFLNSFHFSESDKKFNQGLMGSYIKKLVEKGELSNWSVAVMSTNKANEEKVVELGVNNLKVYGVERRETTGVEEDKEKYGAAIRYVTVMRDELIDLDDLESHDVVKILEDFTLKSSVAPIRNDRPVDRPLLLIYPIYTHHNLNEVEREKICEGKKLRPIISDIKELFAISIVFPVTKQEKFEFNYLANATVSKKAA